MRTIATTPVGSHADRAARSPCPTAVTRQDAYLDALLTAIAARLRAAAISDLGALAARADVERQIDKTIASETHD